MYLLANCKCILSQPPSRAAIFLLPGVKTISDRFCKTKNASVNFFSGLKHTVMQIILKISGKIIVLLLYQIPLS